MSTEVVAVSTVSAEQQQSPSAPAQQNSVAKVNLLGMSRPQLEKFFEDMGEKKFRAGQVMKWIHQFFVTDFAEMTNISGKLREKLEKLCEIKAPEVVHKIILKMVPVSGCFVSVRAKALWLKPY